MTCGDGLKQSLKDSPSRCSQFSASASKRAFRKAVTVALAASIGASVCAIASCHAPGPAIILVPALPDDTEPMLTAEPLHVRVLIWNHETKAFDISQRVWVPAGMTLHFIPIDELIKEWR